MGLTPTWISGVFATQVWPIRVLLPPSEVIGSWHVAKSASQCHRLSSKAYVELELHMSLMWVGDHLAASGESWKKNGTNKKKSRDEERLSPEECTLGSKHTKAVFLTLSPQMVLLA